MLQITVSGPPAPENLQQTLPDLQQKPIILLQVTDPRPLPSVPHLLPEASELPSSIDMQQDFAPELSRNLDLQQNNVRGLSARHDLQQIQGDLQHPVLSGPPRMVPAASRNLDLQHRIADLQQI